MTQPIYHTTIPLPLYLYDADGNTISQVDPATAHHSCNMPGCPGPENKRKLDAFDGLLVALREIANTPCDHGPGYCARDIARAAIAKASPQAQ